MNLSPELHLSLAKALESPSPSLALHALAKLELQKGTPRETLVAWFEAAREHFPEQEDVLLEGLDFLVGWCSPHLRLDHPQSE